MTNYETPVFSLALDRMIDAAWEASHIYQGYEVDTVLLSVGRDILAQFYSPEKDYWSDDRIRQIEEATRLLDTRYDEITQKEDTAFEPQIDETEHEEINQSNLYQGKLKRVLGEWRAHYFLPRTEAVTVAEYDEWVAAFLLYGDSQSVSLMSTQQASTREYRRALNRLDIVPEWTGAPQIIVPPGVEVSSPDTVDVYRWENLSHSGPTARLWIYSSTKQVLAANDRVI